MTNEMTRTERWTAASVFFQRANYERKLISRSTAATLANDWTAFGFREYTMEEFLLRWLHARNLHPEDGEPS